jgi:hypothetical protein
MHSSKVVPAPESIMKSLLIQRAASMSLAALVTLGMLGSIDLLAGQESASALWAAAVMAPRG